MGKLVNYTRICLLLIILMGIGLVYGSTYCRYSIIFMGKTIGTEFTLAYIAMAEGSCMDVQTYYLQFREGELQKVDLVYNRLRIVLPMWNREFTQGDTLAIVKQFEEKDGQFEIGRDRTFTVAPPPYDSTFPPRRGEFWEYPLTSDDELLEKYFDEPIFNNSVIFLYRHPKGIYKNYRISEVYKVDEYLFIKTQSLLDGLDRNYPGVLIYRILNLDPPTPR